MKSMCPTGLFLISLFASFLAAAEPATTQSVKEMMQRTGTGEMGVHAKNQIIPILKKMLPDAQEKFWEEVAEEIDADKIIEMVIPVYQKHLTEDEAQAINAFYRTAAGTKLIQVQPDIMKESMEIGQQWGRDVVRSVANQHKAESEADESKEN